jgi:hypothetical protein
VVDRAPRCIPDERFDELFAQLGSHRDRALVAFWVSTGARASELLGATVGDVDPGRQLITVIRKGTRAMQPLPAAPDAFVWLRLYQVQLAAVAPAGRDQPLWWTLREPLRPLRYDAARVMFNGANAVLGANWSLHDLRHTAAYRMTRDPQMPLTDVQVGARPRPAVHHPALSKPSDRGCDRRAAGVSRPAPPKACRSSSVGPGRERRRHVASGVGAGPAVRVGQSGQPTQPAIGGAGGTGWLPGQPGECWQQRWRASGAEDQPDWRLLVGTNRAKPLPHLASRLLVLMCADVIRPSLDWLLRFAPARHNLAAEMARTRDRGAFAELSALCQGRVGLQCQQQALTNIAIMMAVKDGNVAAVWVGDCLELLATGARTRTTADRHAHSPLFYQLLRTHGDLGPDAPTAIEMFSGRGQPTCEQLIDRYRIACGPVRDVLVNYLRERQLAGDFSTLQRLACLLGKLFWADLEAATSPRRGSSACSPARRPPSTTARSAGLGWTGAACSPRYGPSTSTWPSGPTTTPPAGGRGRCGVRSAPATPPTRRPACTASPAWTPAPANDCRCCPPWSPGWRPNEPAPPSCSPAPSRPDPARCSPPPERPCAGRC